MALSVSQTVALRTLLKDGMRVASMGYPDLIAPDEITNTFFPKGAEIVYSDQFLYRKDSDEICKRHGLSYRKILDAEYFFSVLGCKLDVYDIVKERGCEIVLDLNERIDPILKAWGYDIVLDVGTVEHCFNIAQAMVNMAGMVKHGGYIIHENPFNCGNHGFYNLNPTFYADFYEANGFDVVGLCLSNRHGAQAVAPPGARFKFTQEEVNSFCVAKRVEMRTFVWPAQKKYQKLIPAAGVSGEQKEVANA